MPLPFEPACLPLLLGSLPHRSPAQALDISRRVTGALLAWPQLPRRSYRESNLAQSAAGFPGLVVEEAAARAFVRRTDAERSMDQLSLAYLENNVGFAALSDESAGGFMELLRQAESLRGVRALKGQCLGPISLALQLIDEHQRPLIYDQVLFEALTQHLRLRLMWQEAQLSEVAGTTIICIDEPFLDIVGHPFLPIGWDEARERIDEVLSGVVGCKGLFAPGATDWSQVLQTSVELIIADVYQHDPSLLGAAELIGDFLQRDGVVGFGIVPSDADELDSTTAEELFGRVLALTEQLRSAGVAKETLLRQAVVAPNGALGRLDVARAERALKLVGEVSAMLRERFQLG